MKKIFKHRIHAHGHTVLVLPAGTDILSVGLQDTGPQMGTSETQGIFVWVAQEAEKPTPLLALDKEYDFQTVWTGEERPDDGKHFLATVQFRSGIVTHVFFAERFQGE